MGFEPIREEKMVHTLFGGESTPERKHNYYQVKVSEKGYTCSIEVLDQPVICNPIPVTNGPWLEELKHMNVTLTDVVDSSPIEMLFGADIIGKLYTGRKQELSCGLFVIETLLGWTLIGRVPLNDSRYSTVMTVFSRFVKEAKMTNPWELDAFDISDPVEKRSKEEEARAAKELFKVTTHVDEQGRYVVKLPWLMDHPPLASNFAVAKRRLEATIKKLRLSQMLEEYDTVFKEWLNESIIEKVPESSNNDIVHYLPHRPVVKENSLTTKIRPVFDAPSSKKGSPSLNQGLEVGPNLITLIPDVLLGFRRGRFGVTSDIRKAFLQIAACEEDRDYLRFLWIDDDRHTRVFRHKRVVCGVSTSPFLLGATIDYHLTRCRQNWTEERDYRLETLDLLTKCFYVDNCLTSVPDQLALHSFIREASAVMDEARMDFRGWEDSNPDSIVCKIIPVLGLMWNIKEDTLAVNVESLTISQKLKGGPITKRLILSETQRIFDPIGFSCPVTLQPKLLLHQLWKDKQSWDVPLEGEVVKSFLEWAEDNKRLAEIAIPRWICADENESTDRSLHVFCDASKRAYSAVIFLRVERQGETAVYLVSAKSREAPLKEMTMSRMELLGATIAARLYDSVKGNLPNVQVYFWSDSSLSYRGSSVLRSGRSLLRIE